MFDNVGPEPEAQGVAPAVQVVRASPELASLRDWRPAPEGSIALHFAEPCMLRDGRTPTLAKIQTANPDGSFTTRDYDKAWRVRPRSTIVFDDADENLSVFDWLLRTLEWAGANNLMMMLGEPNVA